MPSATRPRPWATPLGLAILTLAAVVATAAAAPTPAHPPHTGGANEPPPWSYEDPSSWPDSCKGDAQSPMPLRHTPAGPAGRDSLASVVVPAESLTLTAVLAHVDTITLQCNGICGALQVAGMRHAIRQLHWHVPSEHTVDGVRAAAELHIVAEAGGKVAVLATLFQVGETNRLVGKTIDAMVNLKQIGTSAAEVNEEFFGGAVDVGYGTYPGSLTTPPCTEGLTWVVNARTAEMDAEQLGQVHRLNGGRDNARSLQAPHGRAVAWQDTE